jgi:predicted HD phosphohydrolase
MDTATREQWDLAEQVSEPLDHALPERIMTMLASLGGIDDGFAVDQLDHALQTATRAERSGADQEVIVAALLHDVGKIFGDENHDKVSAEIIRPYVRDDVYRVVQHHQDFTARYIAPIFGGDPNRREQWCDESWFDLACEFVDQWDQQSFEPTYLCEPLEHFAPHIRELFGV